MKRLLALLWIMVLLLSGCAIRWEDSAMAGEYVEKEADSGEPASDKQEEAAGNSEKEPESDSKEEDASQENQPDSKEDVLQENPISTESQPSAGKPQTEQQPAENENEDAEPEGGMIFAEALPIATNKAHRQRINKPLTEEQREALSVYLTNENYLYLQGQINGDITAFKEVGMKQYVLEMTILTTKDAVGKDLAAKEIKIAGEFLSPNKIDKKVLGTTELGTVRNHYPRLLNKAIKAPADYLQNLLLNQVVPEGRMRLQLKLNHALAQSEVHGLVEHFLSDSNVTWIEFSYHIEEDSSNPTAIRRFWETEKEMTIEEADAIMMEKIKRRPEEKLSNRERMAFYIYYSSIVDRNFSSFQENKYYVSGYEATISFIAGPDYCNLSLQSAFQLFLNQEDIEINFRDEGKIMDFQRVGSYHTTNNMIYEHMKNGGGLSSIDLKMKQSDWEVRSLFLNQFIKHCLSLDCASAISVELGPNGVPNG